MAYAESGIVNPNPIRNENYWKPVFVNLFRILVNRSLICLLLMPTLNVLISCRENLIHTRCYCCKLVNLLLIGKKNTLFLPPFFFNFKMLKKKC